MLEYDWQLAIGDEFISVSEFEKLVKNGDELIRFKDNFVVISPEEAKAMFAKINKKTKLTTFDLLQAKLNNDAFIDKDLENFIERADNAMYYSKTHGKNKVTADSYSLNDLS